MDPEIGTLDTRATPARVAHLGTRVTPARVAYRLSGTPTVNNLHKLSAPRTTDQHIEQRLKIQERICKSKK